MLGQWAFGLLVFDVSEMFTKATFSLTYIKLVTRTLKTVDHFGSDAVNKAFKPIGLRVFRIGECLGMFNIAAHLTVTTREHSF